MATKRVSPQLAKAIDLLIFNEYSRADAAETAGIRKQTLDKALRKAHVRDFRRERWTAYLNAEAEKSVIKIVKLRDHAKSEKIQFEAAQWLAQGESTMRSMRGHDDGAKGGDTYNSVQITQIVGGALPKGWQPPAGAQVPDHLMPDQQSNGAKVLDHKDSGDASDSE